MSENKISIGIKLSPEHMDKLTARAAKNKRSKVAELTIIVEKLLSK